MAEISPEEVQKAISTTTEPIVLRNFPLDWHIFQITFEEWCEEMDKQTSSKPVEFTGGSAKHCDLPYWERFRTNDLFTFSQFLENSKCDNSRWFSHSYKDISSWPDTLKESISFEKLGFAKSITEDILFWLGSTGANTPCHYDTYGFNIVVQVYGRKSWLLFSPTTKLTETRVPYEESSVYCKQNFYSPFDLDQFNVIGDGDKIYEITLNPGDVLIVPPNYWHYVENLDISLSINTWIPLEKHDSIARLGECFVRLQIDKITEDNEECSRDDLRRYIYNPNETASMDLNLFNLFKPLADIIIENENKTDIYSSTRVREAGQIIRDKFPNIFQKINPITRKQFNDIILNNSLHHDNKMDDRKNVDSHFQDVENVINAVCHPATVTSACEMYIQQVKNETKQ